MSERPLTPRLFRTIYGSDGAEPYISKPDEMWKVRRGAMAICVAARDVYQKVDAEDHAELMEQLRAVFLEAPVGSLMFGYVIRWGNRYVGVLPDGVQLGAEAMSVRVTDVQSAKWLMEDPARPTPRVTNIPAPNTATPPTNNRAAKSVAKRIGEKMARASKEATK